jgi:hypothetical protein
VATHSSQLFLYSLRAPRGMIISVLILYYNLIHKI